MVFVMFEFGNKRFMNKFRYPLSQVTAAKIARIVDANLRNSKGVITSDTVKEVAAGNYQESHPIDCAILAELEKIT